MAQNDLILEVEHLCQHFSVGGGATLKAVDDVSFFIRRREIVGLVGESGCGKTTLGRTVKQIYKPTSGEVRFNGKAFSQMDKNDRREFSRRAQMIFQDPYSSLDPRMTVAEIVAEGMEIHGMYTEARRRERVIELLNLVGLSKEHANRFPHEFSGGQRQRVGIARALALEPEFLVCDEPISALDVSIQAQIVNLFKELREKLGLTYLFIAHDLSMVKYISDRIAVMYLGRIVELTTSTELYRNPYHPYTEFLLSAIPVPDPDLESGREHVRLAKEMPSPINLPEGCSFYDRCPYACEACRKNKMELRDMGGGHWSACDKARKES
ncbi:MAG: ABC transporter ATP-binding protein [Oscillibacter sp.]|nr:ABC transporter ATP-binding protein [Oscillibacter sp.]